MDQQDGAGHSLNRVARGNGVIAGADPLLDIPQHPPPQWPVGNMISRHHSTHDESGVSKSCDAEYRPHAGIARRRQQGGRSTDGMAEYTDAPCQDARLLLKPFDAVLQVFGKLNHGRKAILVALAMASRIKKQQGVPRVMQKWGEGKHKLGVSAPAVQNRDSRCRTWAGRRNKPAEKLLPVLRGDIDSAIKQAERPDRKSVV